QPANEVVLTNLRTSAPADVADLLPELDKRGRQLADQAERRLAERGAKEARDMRHILEDQKKRIEATAAKYPTGHTQLTIRWDKDEADQFAADRRHWDRRLEQLNRELQSEPERIEKLYGVKARRVEPVG